MGEAEVVRRVLERVAVSMPGALFCYEVEHGRVWPHGPRSAGLLGYEAGQIEALGREELRALVHPDDQGRLAATLDEVMRLDDGKAAAVTLRVRRADGAWSCVRADASVFSRREAGPPETLLVCVRPLPESPCEGEAAQGCANTILADLLENVPESLTVTSGPPGFRVIARSRRAAELFGLPFCRVDDLAADRHGHGLYVPNPDTPSRVEQIPAWRAVRSGEVVAGEEWTVRRPDGSTVAVEVHAVPVRQGRSVVAAVSSWREVSERHRLEQALRERTEQLSLVAHKTGACLWRYDFATRALSWSDECRRLFMWSPERVLDHENFLDSIHAGDRGRVARVFDQACREGGGLEVEFRVPLPHGEVRWVYVGAEPFVSESGDPVCLLGVMSDRSASRRAEAALRESERRYRELASRLDRAQHDRSAK